MKVEKVITRRDFLKGTAGVILSTALGPAIFSEGVAQTTSRVVLLRDAKVLDAQGTLNTKILQSMLDQAVVAVTNEKEPLKGWNKLFKKSDIVGIKTNVWRQLRTPTELEEMIRDRILSVGVLEKNIAVDDRGVRNNPVFTNSTALVNVRPVRTHHWAGVGTCLKNYIVFEPQPELYHPDGCSELGKIWTLPGVKGKTRLNILVALTPQFYGKGPHFFDRRYVWPYKGLIVSTDPVAVDAVGAELLRLKRLAHFGEDRALDVAPAHITVADKKYRLGISDLKRIDLIKIGWQENSLL
jgi:hypothetical protein